MDYLLLAILLFFCVKGFLKGFLSMLVSLFGIAGVVALTLVLCNSMQDFFVQKFSGVVSSIIERSLDGKIDGTFSDVEVLINQLQQSNLNSIFIFVLTSILKNVAIEGQLSFSQILSPILAKYLIKFISFAIIFIVLYVGIRIIVKILNKIVKKIGISYFNRFLGMILGAIKGLIFCTIIYLILTSIASLGLNNGLTQFVQMGSVSGYIYNNYLTYLLSLIYHF